MAAYRRSKNSPPLSLGQQAFNRAMSKARTAVEWGFLQVAKQNAYIDLYSQLKFWKTPVAQYYQAATLLTNFHTCMHGNQTGKYFDVLPPTLHNYIEMLEP